MGSTSTANACLELHIGIGMHCHEPILRKPSTQSHLSKIKPHMFRRVMLMNEYYSQEESSSTEIDHDPHEASELSCNIKMIELFPQRRGFADSSISAKAKLNALSEEDDRIVNVTHSQPAAEQSTSQLTIFYNGAIKVFDVSAYEAKVIMMMAAGNTLQQTSSFDGASFAIRDVLPLRGSLIKNSSTAGGCLSGPNPNSDAEIPLAKKLSLQRFLQKRKDRIKRRVPYPTSAK